MVAAYLQAIEQRSNLSGSARTQLMHIVYSRHQAYLTPGDLRHLTVHTLEQLSIDPSYLDSLQHSLLSLLNHD